MQKVLNFVDVRYTRFRKDLRARKNLAFRRSEVEDCYAKRYAVRERLYAERTNVCNARCVFCYYPKVADDDAAQVHGPRRIPPDSARIQGGR